jgi:hypothetical protein
MLIDSANLVGSCMGAPARGSRMRATMKFAVICVSLLIAALADAAGQRNQINALDFQERGARLRLELERAYQDLRHTGVFKSAGNDVSSIVEKYVPVGTSFANAETTLRSSGFTIDPLPPRESPENLSPLRSGEHELMMRFAILGTLVLAQQGFSRITVEITLLLKTLGDHNTVKGVHAVIYYRGV